MQKFWGLKGDQIKHLKEKIWTIEMSKLQQCWYYSKLDILWIFIKASRVLLKIDNTCLNRFHAKFSWPFYLARITNWMSTGQIQTSNAFCLTHTMLKKWLRDFFKKIYSYRYLPSTLMPIQLSVKHVKRFRWKGTQGLLSWDPQPRLEHRELT